MATTSDSLPWTPARQARSRRTAERIVASALDLMGEQTFDRMSVGQIAERAGISVGGFYARFSSKDALLDYLNHTVLDGIVTRVQQSFTPEASIGLSASDLIRRYIQMAVETFREHGTVLSAVSLRSRTSRDPEFRERVRQANRSMHDVFRTRLRERCAECSHPEPTLAIDLALTAVSGAMREYVLFADQRPQFDPIADERLITELTHLFCSYLGI